MNKFCLLVFSFFICHLGYSDSPSEGLSISKPTMSGFFTANLSCSSLLPVGQFKNCYIEILGLKHSQTGKSLNNVFVNINGGMPEHAHGLPTAPKVVWSDKQSAYEIKGLKFNMLGKWQLHFFIEDKEYNIKDTVTFNFTI